MSYNAIITYILLRAMHNEYLTYVLEVCCWTGNYVSGTYKGPKNTRLSIGSTKDDKLNLGFFVGFLGSTWYSPRSSYFMLIKQLNRGDETSHAQTIYCCFTIV